MIFKKIELEIYKFFNNFKFKIHLKIVGAFLIMRHKHNNF